MNRNKRINLGLVLSNLTDSNAEEILSSLKKMYFDIHEESLSSEENLVLQYLRKYKQLGRVLNEEELNKMGIAKTMAIDEDVLKDQVDDYILYNTSKYRMFHSNLGLISSYAYKYSKIFKIDKMDLIQEGNIGLMKAVNGFDVDMGNKFSTYATSSIVRTILKYASDNFSPVKTTSQYWIQHRDFQKRKSELEEETGRSYSAAELSKIFDMNYEDVLDFMLYNPNPTHLDQKVGEDEDITICDLLSDDNIDFDKAIFFEQLREVFSHYIHKLPSNAAQVIRLLYGINDQQRSYTEKEVSKMLNISIGAVGFRHRKALAIIRTLVHRNGNKDHLQYFK